MPIAPTPVPLGGPTDGIPLLVERFAHVDILSALLNYPPLKALLPLPLLALLAVPIWLVFRRTWRRIEAEAVTARTPRRRHHGRLYHRWRLTQTEQTHTAPSYRSRRRRVEQALEKHYRKTHFDYRPAACFIIVAVVLTMQEYYGGRRFYESTLEPMLRSMETAGLHWLKVDKYTNLYGYGWWSASRVIGYVFVPVPIWMMLFPKDSLLDMGLRIKGFVKHLWIYGVCLAIVLPVMFFVSRQPDFGSYYPFYKQASRSWFDFLAWEAMYFCQFLALEFFFRGWMVSVLRRTLGAAAIFAMAVPYCMIHYGKPYLEANGAIVAGVVLGSLAMRTRSIYAGFLLHITVAFGMDWLSLFKRGELPHVFWAGG